METIAPVTAANFLNIVLGAAVTLLTTILIPLAILWGREMIAKRRLSVALTEKQLRDAIDSGAQKAIGAALGDVKIPAGKMPPTMKAEVVEAAAATLAKNYPDSFTALGVTDIPAKATEIVASRIGLMDAQAAGNPVPNPTQAATTPPTPI